MKRWLKISIGSIFGIGLIVVIYMTQQVQDALILSVPDIKIHVDDEHVFITEKEVLELLRFEALIFDGQRKDQLDAEAVESYLKTISQVRDVKVYLLIGSQWKIDIDMRKPIARIYNKWGQTYYLDDEGNMMEISSQHAARLLVVTGEIPDHFGQESLAQIINNDSLKSIRKLDDIYWISNYVCNDPFFRSLIGQVHFKKNGDFVLIPLVGDQKIVFGSAYSETQVSKKFEKLRVFYNEGMPYEGWGKYSEISLKYEDQIVCKRKNKIDE
ncbi:hypothetical protein OAU25_00040 [Crocinitomicaceae bacterium]|nr:hypothetical protein [Crocinitomicaceae bacterium]